MKWLIGIFVFNLLLLLSVFFTIWFSKSDFQLTYLVDVSDKSIAEGLEKLKDFEVNIYYVDSSVSKDQIVSTEPKANSLVYLNQVITVYVSKGVYRVPYHAFVNESFQSVEGYLDELKDSYALDIKINYVEDFSLPDGLIKEVIMEDNYLDYQDSLEFVVIRNIHTVILPNMIGWSIDDAMKYAKEKDIRVSFVYQMAYAKEDTVIGQSVSAGSLVLKNGNEIILYIAKGEE